MRLNSDFAPNLILNLSQPRALKQGLLQDNLSIKFTQGIKTLDWLKSGYFLRCFSPRIGKFVVTSISNIPFLPKKEHLGKRVVCYLPSPSLYRQHNANKREKCEQEGEFPKFCAIARILKLLIIAKIAAANYDVRVSRYQSICDFYRYFTALYNADFSRVEGLFYTFHFLPSQRALAFFNTTRREAKA